MKYQERPPLHEGTGVLDGVQFARYASRYAPLTPSALPSSARSG